MVRDIIKRMNSYQFTRLVKGCVTRKLKVLFACSAVIPWNCEPNLNIVISLSNMANVTRTPPPQKRNLNHDEPEDSSTDEKSTQVDKGQVDTLIGELKSYNAELTPKRRGKKKNADKVEVPLSTLLSAIEVLKKDLTREVKSVKTDVNRGLNVIEGLKIEVNANSQKLD